MEIFQPITCQIYFSIFKFLILFPEYWFFWFGYLHLYLYDEAPTGNSFLLLLAVAVVIDNYQLLNRINLVSFLKTIMILFRNLKWKLSLKDSFIQAGFPLEKNIPITNKFCPNKLDILNDLNLNLIFRYLKFAIFICKILKYHPKQIIIINETIF